MHSIYLQFYADKKMIRPQVYDMAFNNVLKVVGPHLVSRIMKGTILLHCSMIYIKMQQHRKF